jgi:hypothetical protein
MNLDLTSTCIDLSWTDARAAKDLIRMIILSHTDDKMTLSLKKRIRVKALPSKGLNSATCQSRFSPDVFEVSF